MVRLPSDDVYPNGKKLTRSQHKLLNEIRENGGELIVDGRRATVAKSLQILGAIDLKFDFEIDWVHQRPREMWHCRLRDEVAASAKAEGRTNG